MYEIQGIISVREKNGHLKQEESWMPMAMSGFNSLVV